MVRPAFWIGYNGFNLGNRFSWNITGDETKLDFFMIMQVRDDEGLSKSSGNKDGGEQINSCSIRWWMVYLWYVCGKGVIAWMFVLPQIYVLKP